MATSTAKKAAPSSKPSPASGTRRGPSQGPQGGSGKHRGPAATEAKTQAKAAAIEAAGGGPEDPVADVAAGAEEAKGFLKAGRQAKQATQDTGAKLAKNNPV